MISHPDSSFPMIFDASKQHLSDVHMRVTIYGIRLWKLLALSEAEQLALTETERRSLTAPET